ncbi:protein FAM221B-like [Watersipora subatra]|uniref:protein FAM221B-like n=1 Tax=Watersipora subatra TaxID=2589382 RepID=UPI00355C7734
MDPMPMDKLPDGTLAPKGYTMRPVVAAENYDVISFARAMNDDFAPRVKKLFDPERKAAVEAQKSGVYIGWRLPGQKFDCQRISDTSLCFCGHLLGEHAQYNGRSTTVPCNQMGCRCPAYQWIPSRPEDVGEFWHQRRRNFDPSTWRAKCRCKHSHEEHDCRSRRCKMKGCPCAVFNSNFLCAACDKHWEQHATFFETEAMRRKEGLPVGEAYLPFAEMPNLRNAVLTGDEHDESAYLALTGGQGHIPITEKPQGNDAVFNPGGKQSGFRSVYD